jgi:hypothetical protein
MFTRVPVFQVYISHNLREQLMYLPPNVKQVPGIKSASSEGFTLQDDSSVKADALIYCTGRLTNSEMKGRRGI